MDGVSRAGSAPYIIVKVPKCFKGTGEPNGPEEGFDEFKWPPMRIEEYAIVERHLLKERKSPVDAVLPELERLAGSKSPGAKRLARRLEEKAYQDLRKGAVQNKLSMDEVQAWLDTPEGIHFTTKLCMQRYHPEITDRDVRRMLEWTGEQEAKRLRDLAQGIDALGNSTGLSSAESAATQAETNGATATASSEGRRVLTGDGSIATLPKSTDGVQAPSTS